MVTEKKDPVIKKGSITSSVKEMDCDAVKCVYNHGAITLHYGKILPDKSAIEDVVQVHMNPGLLADMLLHVLKIAYDHQSDHEEFRNIFTPPQQQETKECEDVKKDD